MLFRSFAFLLFLLTLAIVTDRRLAASVTCQAYGELGNFCSTPQQSDIYGNAPDVCDLYCEANLEDTCESFCNDGWNGVNYDSEDTGCGGDAVVSGVGWRCNEFSIGCECRIVA